MMGWPFHDDQGGGLSSDWPEMDLNTPWHDSLDALLADLSAFSLDGLLAELGAFSLDGLLASIPDLDELLVSLPDNLDELLISLPDNLDGLLADLDDQGGAA